jgi:uncharacterized membrane protein YkoI
MKRMIVISGIAVAAIGIGMGGDALADTEKSDDAAAMLAAKVTLTDAIATAEKEAGGKAIEAGMDDQDGTVFIAVSVAQGEKVQKVLIDPQTGKVVKVGAKEDDEEDDDENDE